MLHDIVNITRQKITESPDTRLAETAVTRRRGNSDNNSISQFVSSVNGEERFSREINTAQIETEAFKNWVGGDWQNEPENAPKVINEDGAPMVVYHGTNADYTTFE